MLFIMMLQHPPKTTPCGILHAGLTASAASPIAAAANDIVYPPYLPLLQKFRACLRSGVVGWSGLCNLALALLTKMANVLESVTLQKLSNEAERKHPGKYFAILAIILPKQCR